MVARALASCGRLAATITDAWYEPESLAAKLSDRLRGRYHSQLASERVEAPSYKSIVDEFYARCTGAGGWPNVVRRNQRFEEMAARRLRTLMSSGVRCDTVFAYSYAANTVFKAARSLGLRTVLGQIDPGPLEDEIVSNLYRAAGQSDRYERIPPRYWSRWREEIALSDIVVANSAWSQKLLVHAGVPTEKVSVVPLAYDGPGRALRPERSLPNVFTSERPLRLLFLGQLTFRKGIGPLLAAMQRIPHAPLSLDLVGDLQIDLPDSTKTDRRIRVHGAVPRSAVHQYYEAADLFVFPTLSDGFGLTQLEALAHGLPVLTSRNCGRVVTHGHDGFVLDDVTPRSIEAALLHLVAQPARLRRWSMQARIPEAFSQATLAARLSELKVVA